MKNDRSRSSAKNSPPSRLVFKRRTARDPIKSMTSLSKVGTVEGSAFSGYKPDSAALGWFGTLQP